MATATATDTFSTVDINTPAGRAFLRRVARESREEWHFMAEAGDGWRVSFWRRVPGSRPGDCDATVTVETNAGVSVGGDTGTVSPFSDATPVAVPAARRVHCFGAACRTAAALMACGWRLAVEHSAGSTTSSRYGLAFLRLEAYRNGYMESATIGESVFKDGDRIIAGPVEA